MILFIFNDTVAVIRTRRSRCGRLDNKDITVLSEVLKMKRIITVNAKDIKKTAVKGGCGECQTSCQSACKTSCGVANQKCENTDRD